MSAETNAFLELIRQSKREPREKWLYCKHCDCKHWHMIRANGRDEIHICRNCKIGTTYTVK